MECLEKAGCSQDKSCYMENGILKAFDIKKPDTDIYKAIRKNLDGIAKPIDGLGRFEELIARLGAIQDSEQIDISKKAVIIMCADNGIVAEGISQSGQEVTLAVAKNMAAKTSSVCRMAKHIGADTIPVDIGMNTTEQVDGVLNKKVAFGTGNFKNEPAMSRDEVLQAVLVGMEMVKECKEKGYTLLATGEMGIGNTTTSSACAAALLHCKAAKVTGRGAGLCDEALRHKIEVIDEALEKYDLYHADALEILQTVGGLDLCGIAGICIGGAAYQVPIVLDGIISMVGALFAERLVPGVREYLIPSHKGKEPAVQYLAKELCVDPVIEADMALGEGTGAVMMFSLLDMALCIYQDRTTFSDIHIEEYERFQQP